MSEPARLYLLTPRLTDVAPFLPALTQALATQAVECVLLRFAPGAASRDAVSRAAPVIQAAGAALLLEGEPRDAARAGADGAHVQGADDALQAALDSLKPDRIVGVGGLSTRDDCMRAGEAGADYLMFGEPKADGYVPPLETTLERTEWWAKIFNVPCVAFAGALGDIEVLADAGAEFVAVGDAIWNDPRGPAAAIADAEARLERGAK